MMVRWYDSFGRSRFLFEMLPMPFQAYFNRQMSSAKYKSPSTFSLVQSIPVFVSSFRLIIKSKTIPNKTIESIQPCLTPVYVFPVQSNMY